MFNDASMSEIIESWKTSNYNKLMHDQWEMKKRIRVQFQKISKEGLVTDAIMDVYTLVVFDKPSAPLGRFTCYPKLSPGMMAYISEHLQKFYDETSIIGEDGFNLMTYMDYLLNSHTNQQLFWCSYPQISYDIIEEADTYFFTLIQFDASVFRENLYFEGELHPLIKALNYAWITQYKENSYDNAFRKAAASMNDLLGGVWDHVNLLSTLKYEGSQNRGSILFTDSHEPRIILELALPVSLSEYRQIRKLLQMSRPGHYLLVDRDYMAIGFGTIESDSPIYRIDFLDHLHWKLYHGNDEFLACSNLLPLLPNNNTDLYNLKHMLERTFEGMDYDPVRILEIIRQAKFQRKGTMIVITERAKEEAERLSASTIKIVPTSFTNDQLNLVTKIDGAAIFDTYGICHAIGTIMDGYATENGDPSRGARFNSALRYLNSQVKQDVRCMVAVISEDRYVDILSSADEDAL